MPVHALHHRVLARPTVGSVLLALVLLGFAAPAQAVTQPAASQVVAGQATRLAAAQALGTRVRKQARRERVERMLRIVRNQKGDPYRYGAAGPRRFDCSGLVYFSTHQAGFRRVPRTSSQQAGFMRRIPRKAMRRGDFVFFTGGSGVYHVGVFAGRRSGRRMIVHAPGSGQRVTTARIWTDRWFAGTLR